MGRLLRMIGRALVRRCPRCGESKIFRRWFTMVPHCPRCGLLFEREEGYWTGAMYVSYMLSLGLMSGIFIVLFVLSSRTFFAVQMMLLLTAAIAIPFVPLLFRYSRVMWLYFDMRFGPDQDSSR